MIDEGLFSDDEVFVSDRASRLRTKKMKEKKRLTEDFHRTQSGGALPHIRVILVLFLKV